MRKLLIWISIISTLAGVYFLSVGIIKYYQNPALTFDDWSNLGQFVSGFAVAFFTLATILLITLAYINQREEIEHLRGMNTQQEFLIDAQIKKDKYEKFERTFYRKIEWHERFRNTISARNDRNDILIGRAAINQVLTYFKRNLNTYKNQGSQEALNKSFNEMFSGELNDMDPYFYNLYSVLEFVDSSFYEKNIDANEADKFTTIIFSQLSISEKELLYYYGLYNKAPKNLKEILERNGIIKNFDKRNIPQEYKTKYKERN